MHVNELNPAFGATLLSRIEDAGLSASAPLQQRWVDGWSVRLSPGKAKRSRCVNAVAAGSMPFDQRLGLCVRMFEDVGLPPIVRITPFTIPDTLDVLLAQRGWRRFDDTRVMVLAHLPAYDAAEAVDVSIEVVGLDAFAHRVGGYRGSSKAQCQAHSERLHGSLVPLFAFELRTAGKPVACGHFALDGEFVGLYDVFTSIASRGQGLAHKLCKHLLTQAALHGARYAYLQVECDNHPARSLYRRLGFIDGYAYHYRTCDPSST